MFNAMHPQSIENSLIGKWLMIVAHELRRACLLASWLLVAHADDSQTTRYYAR